MKPPIELITDNEEFIREQKKCQNEVSYFAKMYLGVDIFDYNIPYINCKNRFIIARHARQLGKCLYIFSDVYTPNGIVKAKDIKHGQKILGGTVVDPYTFEDDLIKLTFGNGIKIKVNGEHPFYTDHGWVNANKLNVKDKVEFTSPAKYEFNNFSVGNMAKFWGYMYSDGYYSKKQSPKFTNTNLNFHKEVVETINSNYPELRIVRDRKTKSELETKPGYDTRFVMEHGSSYGKNRLVNYIREHDMMNKDSFNKIQMLPEHELKEFIRGYFNGDGYLSNTFHKSRKSYKCEIGFAIGNSENRANEFQFMLWRLGINSYVKSEIFKGHSRRFYRVMVSRTAEVMKLLSFLDRQKYPDKFAHADQICASKKGVVTNTFVNIKKIEDVGRGEVVGFGVLPSHEIISYCGMRTHNSFNLAIKLLHFAYFAPLLNNKVEDTCNIISVSFTKDQAKHIFNYAKKFIKRSSHLSEALSKDITKTEMHLNFFDGSGETNIQVIATGDEGTNVRGYTVHLIICDEAAHMKDEIFDALVPTGFAGKAHLWLISTPLEEAGFFYDACQKSFQITRQGKVIKLNEKTDENIWEQFHATSYENPENRDDPIFKSFVGGISEAVRQSEIYGEFRKSGKTLISNDLIMKARDKTEIPKMRYKVLSVDTSGKGDDETVCMDIDIGEDFRAYPTKIYTEDTTNQTDLAKKIEELHKARNYYSIYMDTTALGDGLYDACKRTETYLPIHPINFRSEKMDIYNDLVVCFEREMINLSLFAEGDTLKFDKLRKQIKGAWADYGKEGDRVEPKIRNLASNDDQVDALAMGIHPIRGRYTYRPSPPDLFNENIDQEETQPVNMMGVLRL